MNVPATDRRILVRSRLAEGYLLTEIGQKQLQHILTDWFPRAVYADLTDETVRLDVLIRPGRMTGRNVYKTTFVQADGSVAKTLDYDEDRLPGTVCKCFDRLRSGYCGEKDGYHYRVFCYSAAAPGFRPR